MSHDISNHLVDKIRTSKARICLQLDKSTEYQMKYICCFTVDKYMLDAKKEVLDVHKYRNDYKSS